MKKMTNNLSQQGSKPSYENYPSQTCYITTLGCSKNQVDSELLVYALEKQGFKLVPSPEAAEAIIINTCGFIEAAQQESINAILEAVVFRQEGLCKVLAVTGCLSQRFGKDLFASLPEIDIVLGTGNFLELPDLLRNRINLETGQNKGQKKDHKVSGEDQRLFCVGAPEEFCYPAPDKRTLLTAPHSVYLKIAEGCSNCCSYCIIPSIRGGYRSRGKESILAEAGVLLAQGAKEINLIAQDTSAYGLDLGSGEDLAGLLEDLAALKGMGWLRVLYTYPTQISKRLLHVMRDFGGTGSGSVGSTLTSGSVCRYLDIPLQHVNENILASMNRQGNYESLYTLMCTIRDTVPDISLRTTFITGYPGETEKEFEELMSFMEKVQFDWVGVFPFSPQEGTPAYDMKPRVSSKDAGKRAEALMEFQAGITEKRNLRHLGQTMKVLVEDFVADPVEDCIKDMVLFTGRTEGQAPEVDGIVYLKGALQRDVGQFIDAKITGVNNYDLVGEVIR